MSLSELFDRLDLNDTDHLSYGTDHGQGFRGGHDTVANLRTRDWPTNANCWVGLNPMNPDTIRPGGRGEAKDVTRLTALYADLDVKQGGLPTSRTAGTVVADLTSIFDGVPPTAVILSGHGLQPIWAVEDCDPVTGAELLNRFKTLVITVAAAHNGNVDSTYDLARILRVPDTTNIKSDPHVPTGIALPTQWRPLAVHELTDIFDRYGITPHTPAIDTSNPISPPQDWQWGDTTCGYARAMIDGWATDEPKHGRHPWIGNQLHRLHAAHRAGCLTEHDHQHGRARLLQRFADLCEKGIGGDPRKVRAADTAYWDVYAIARIAAKPDADLWKELGGSIHPHAQPIQGDNTNPFPAQPDRFLTREGLLVADLAHHVEDHLGPFAIGPEGKLWRYIDGVYTRDGNREIDAAIVATLANRYRTSHGHNTESVLTARTRLSLTGDTNDSSAWINCRNGLLHWRTGELHPHTPDIPTTAQIPVTYDPTATCPNIDGFLTRTLGGAGMVEFFAEVTGAVLYGGAPFHQRAIMLEGAGSNGKSVALHLLMAMVGKRNCASIPPQAFDTNRFAVASLFGKLANIVGDVDGDVFARTAMFKAITAGDLIAAEEKYAQPYLFRPTATIVASFNEAPQTADRSDGFFRRWLVVPFPNRFVDRPTAAREYSRDPHVEQHITTPAELSGWLNRAIAGLQRLRQRGDFVTPDNVIDATDRFRTNADPIRQWFDDCVQVDVTQRAPRVDLYTSYGNWCVSNGFRPVNSRKFYGSVRDIVLAATGPDVVNVDEKSNGVRYFTCVNLPSRMSAAWESL